MRVVVQGKAPPLLCLFLTDPDGGYGAGKLHRKGPYSMMRVPESMRCAVLYTYVYIYIYRWACICKYIYTYMYFS